jgi:hypothetical protein
MCFINTKGSRWCGTNYVSLLLSVTPTCRDDFHEMGLLFNDVDEKKCTNGRVG